MCGIAGEISFRHESASASTVERMLQKLESRGPDGSGVYQHNHVALGHRRLKIIDLSENASQPMTDRTLGLTVVFNGAIYNYPDLRVELEKKGYSFFSTGDTEVILKAYHAWGEDCVQKFNGMFAFAIHELESGDVFIARDRLGIKPFYYQRTSEHFRFASTLPALLINPDVNTEIDPEALNYYMSFHAVVPAPHTILKGIRKLPPAHCMRIFPDGNIQEKTYWSLEFRQNGKFSEAEWTDRVEHTLRQAVQRRLVADVPVGVLLSGGLDSSLIVGMLHEAGQKNLHTFSIGFADVNEEEGNEFRYSDIIAQRFKTSHHKIYASDDLVQEHLPSCIRAMSEPMVSHDVIGFYLLSREVSKHVKVVQSGQGADEVFAGYHWYPPLLDSPPERAVRDYANLFFDRDFNEYQKVVRGDYLKQDYATRFAEEHFSKPGATAVIDKALRLDTTIMLVDDPVKRVDNMTMAWGLEARVPFLDHELVELASQVPATLKVRDTGKYVLKEVGRRVIPHEVIDRPKGYFPVPALKYLEGPYLAIVREVLERPRAKTRNLFNPDYLSMLFQAPKQYITPLRGSKLWQIGLLEFWLQEQGL